MTRPYLDSRVDRDAFTLIELLVVMGIMVILISILLPVVSQVQRTAREKMIEAEHHAAGVATQEIATPEPRPQAVPKAIVRRFDAAISLAPRLSVGTVEPESIYETEFNATLSAERPDSESEESEIELPLPPQIISLGSLTFSVGGQPSDAFSMRGDKLVWRGALPEAEPATIDVTYSAVGKGLFSLQTPPGGILDLFKIELIANGSDVRMLELSLQPTSLVRSSGSTKYVWDYRRLMFGRPIALDVLGIAPIDRLGELRWLGPLSVIAFGIVLGLVAKAYRADHFDKWMLLLVLGLFTGAYPLMYFAQTFIPLILAASVVGGSIVLLITIRMVTLIGFWLGTIGVMLPAALIMTLALMATLQPNLQGILLTTLAIALFALAMMLAPKLNGLSEPSPTPATA